MFRKNQHVVKSGCLVGSCAKERKKSVEYPSSWKNHREILLDSDEVLSNLMGFGKERGKDHFRAAQS
jgi:hypothetical protein